MSDEKFSRILHVMVFYVFLFLCAYMAISAKYQLHLIDLWLIFSLEIVWYGYDLYVDGEQKRNLALYNQEARRGWRETDFDEVWTV